MAQTAPLLASLSSSTVTSLRDREWEERERSYHDTAIAELNSLVRKYNLCGSSSILFSRHRTRESLP
ncbi:hypothetical protein JVT61DRAFT_12851 [Boletus reticuloceps]|uniref:Uncharacterized protein n=1 Tax=Boletus reticuloceps TaxID=495285 RepID=A0A8I2YUV7_9AGAM|nr:hypothetical protein JVT61DRAFT_12851 [Boletus reticuloceps]